MKIPKAESKSVEFKTAFNQDTIVSLVAFARRMNPGNPDDPMRLLRKLSLIKDDKPTNACYLAFVADYCSETAFQAGRFKTRSHIIDDTTFNSDILAQLDGVMEFIMKHLRLNSS